MPKILLIDDNVIVRNAISTVLRQSGFDVELAINGQQGFAAFLQCEPDLVITDIIMPEKDGIETIMKIRKQRPTAKIIAISGGGRVGTMDFLHVAKSFGASAVLAKPIEPKDLLNCVNACLAA